MKRFAVGLVAGLVAVFLATAASAAPSFKDRLEAQKLAAEGKRQATAKDYKKAAKAYEKADELNPSPSYKLERARALVELGNLTAAASALAECMNQAQVPWNEKTAQKGCIDLASKVDDRLPRLHIDVFKPSADEVSVTVDDEEYDISAGELRHNPGSVEIVAKAKGYVTFRKTVKLAEADRQTLEISLDPKEKQVAKVQEEEEDDGGGISPIPAFVLWGVGAVGIGVGVGFGVAAINTTDQVIADYNCEDGECDSDAQDDLDVAKLNGNISTAGFIAGGVLVAGGTILFLFSGDDDDEGDEGDNAGVEAHPLLGPGFVGVHGKF